MISQSGYLQPGHQTILEGQPVHEEPIATQHKV